MVVSLTITLPSLSKFSDPWRFPGKLKFVRGLVNVLSDNTERFGPGSLCSLMSCICTAEEGLRSKRVLSGNSYRGLVVGHWYKFEAG